MDGDLIIHDSIEADIYKPKNKYITSVSKDEVNNKLGTNLNDAEILKYLQKVARGIDGDGKVSHMSVKEMLLGQIESVHNAKPKYLNPSNMRQDAPHAFSCSSLISYLYNGIYMPSISIDKYLYTRDLACDIRSIEDLKFGDLIFINTGEVKVTGIYYEGKEYKKGERVEAGVDHLGMYVGDGKVLHASSKLQNSVEAEDIKLFLERGVLVGYGRVFSNLDEKRYYVEVPSERLDIRIKEDLVEEVARYYGLDKITSTLPTIIGNQSASLHKRMYYENVIKKVLLSYGYSEVYTYSFANKGDIEILKALSKDKSKLRNNLSDGIAGALESNLQNMPLLDQKDIRIFEFGNCFKVKESGEAFEWRSLAIGIDDGKKKSNFIEIADALMLDIAKALEIDPEDLNELVYKSSNKPIIYEIDFGKLIELLPNKQDNILLNVNNSNKYNTFSLMPFIVRDIAVWVNSNVKSDEILNVISPLVGELCISVKLFDEFTKDDKTSYAFRLIFQSKDRTLTDSEVATYVDPIYEALKSSGWEVR
jgi:phenylalanyl-tRNA synthetase beta subunit